MSVLNRKLMVIYRSKQFAPGTQGVCECGHQFCEKERFMAYPDGEGMHWFVCLTCHFWNVHKAKTG